MVCTVCALAVPDFLRVLCGLRESFRRGCYGHTEALISGLSPLKLNKTIAERACVGLGRRSTQKDDRDSLQTPKRSESACTRVLPHISTPTWKLFSSASYRDSLLQLDEISVPVELFFFSSFRPLTVAVTKITSTAVASFTRDVLTVAPDHVIYRLPRHSPRPVSILHQ